MSHSKQVQTRISPPAASLSTVVADVLDESLTQQQDKERAKAAFARYQPAFAGFNEEELMILDGIIPAHQG